jgi:hypothetical protein
MFGWILFRSATLGEALERWLRMCGVRGADTLVVPRASIISDVGLSMLIFAGVWCLVVEPFLERLKRQQPELVPLYHRMPLLYPLLVIVCLLSLLVVEAGKYSPFIYFQF